MAELLRDANGFIVPQYYDRKNNKYVPISIRSVSGIVVRDTYLNLDNSGNPYEHQYLDKDGKWIVYRTSNIPQGVSAYPNLISKVIIERISNSSGNGNQGPKGEPGERGPAGLDGKSAYQIAVSNGFSGSESDWLASLKGEPGAASPPGSSGDLTSASITQALGYVPVKPSDVTWANVLSKPSTFAPSAHTHDWNDVTNKPTTFSPASHSHAWSEITGKPSTYAPSAHTHSYNDLSNKPVIPALNNTVTSTSTSEAATANAVKQAYDRANAAFTQASNGKTAIADAITGKGGTVPNDATFNQLASAISNIPSGGSKSKIQEFGYTRNLSVSDLPFSPSCIIIRGVDSSNSKYTLATRISADSGSSGTSLLNSYSLLADLGNVFTLPANDLTLTNSGFTFTFPSTVQFRGIWVAYE